MNELLSLLIWLFVAALVAAIVYYLLTLLPLPQPFQRIVLVVFVLICLVVVLQHFLPILSAGPGGSYR